MPTLPTCITASPTLAEAYNADTPTALAATSTRTCSAAHSPLPTTPSQVPLAAPMTSPVMVSSRVTAPLSVALAALPAMSPTFSGSVTSDPGFGMFRRLWQSSIGHCTRATSFLKTKLAASSVQHCGHTNMISVEAPPSGASTVRWLKREVALAAESSVCLAIEVPAKAMPAAEPAKDSRFGPVSLMLIKPEMRCKLGLRLKLLGSRLRLGRDFLSLSL
mmetsp:Transcript_27337/g.55036  ORF Transcript_27337/g.55036 Transcript_27337/m.55036 type:complete len:219 (-) Transcript_27337:418-1074(-)